MLKKALTIVCCALVISFAWVISSQAVFSSFSSKTEVYQRKNSSCADVTSISNEQLPLSFYRYGEAVTFDGKNFRLEEILDAFNASLKFTEQTEFGVSYYAYSKDLKYSCLVKGEKINLHVFINQDSVKLGSPILFGSY